MSTARITCRLIIKSIKMLIIAHRGGLEWNLGENNLAAFTKVIEHNKSAADNTGPINQIELDVRITGDRVLVCAHDPKINRQSIAKLNYKQLTELAGSKRLNIPSLEAVLKLCQSQISLDIELKEAGYELDAVNLIKQYLNYDQYIITSFRHGVITTVKQIDSQINTGLLIAKANSSLVSDIIQTRANLVLPHYKIITSKLVQTIRQLDKPIYTWTVNRLSTMQKLADLGVDGIITDRPKRAANYFNNGCQVP